MSSFKRRHFLLLASSTLATLGLGQLGISQQGSFDTKAYAQNTPRKLALLVGINEYSDGVAQLSGCVNDVLLQRELLIHRFGFNPQDILTLTDKQATRKGILQAFEEHLIKQAKPGDVVVFHFSGHGSRVIDADRDHPDGLVSSLVAVDSQLASENSSSTKEVTGHTLWLLMAALKTENVTFVIDTIYSGGLVSSALKSSQLKQKFQVSPEEKAYQASWLQRLGLSVEEFIKQRRIGIPKGVVLASARRDQFAIDASFNDFNAGLFTYTLTQYLWQQSRNQTLGESFVNIASNVKALSFEQGNFQEPVLFVKPNSDYQQRPMYFIGVQTPRAEAVITQVKENQIEIWLGGVNPKNLENLNQGAVFEIINAEGQQQGIVKLESRKGLVGYAKLLESPTSVSLKPGLLLREKVRATPSR
ncbi:peptidase C14 caspase catalytic subunit p20 (plasmid) [Calothrix brevissima NIES-22]|nr:peptidase C14 caspase catalytic subunit p20 [Calothrix brevissima NIES-22]